METCKENSLPKFAASDAAVVVAAKIWTRKFLWHWEGSAMSPGDASEIIVNHLIEAIGACRTNEVRDCQAEQCHQLISPCSLHPKKCPFLHADLNGDLVL